MLQIDKALEIDGFMEPMELGWLAKQAQKHKVIVEIGSFLGRSTRALADNTTGIVYAVDDWRGPRDVKFEITAPEFSAPFELFLHNMRGLEGRLHVVKADHGNIDLRDIPVLPDMVFIDGDHSYKSVVRDIEFWMEHSAPGALICGHDYSPMFVDVRLAVDTHLKNVSVAPRTAIWFVEKSSCPFQKYSA